MSDREFVGEVYWSGGAFIGIWQVREGQRVIEQDDVRCLSRDSARWHVSVAACERGFDWQG